jgi:uncharacterized membrane protein YcaP (DUF421 family)
MEEWFGSGPGLSVAQEAARAAVVFAYGMFLVRLFGRRVFGRWAALDIVVSIVVGSNLSRALTGSAPFGGTLVATGLLMLLHFLLARAAAHWPSVSRAVEGAAVELARDGRTDAAMLEHHAVTRADLAEALRAAGLSDERGAARIVLEPSGKITVLKAP